MLVATNVGTAGQPCASNADGSCTFADPLVQGTQAAGSTTIPNPVVSGGSDYSGTPTVRVLKVDSSGQIYFGNASLAVTGTFFQATQPVSLTDGADTTLGAKADAKSTATDTTAVSIMSVLKEISNMEQNPASRAVTNAGTFAVQDATVEGAISSSVMQDNIKNYGGAAVGQTNPFWVEGY